MTRPTVRVGLYGFFGNGNAGNEGSLAAFLAYMRANHPQASLRCYAVEPDCVTRDHGIPAVQLMTYRREGGGALVKCLKTASRIWDIPRTFVMMKDVDVLVVPGTGVLETKLGTQPWGLPYWLFLATLSCRLRGRQVVLVSVGAAPANNPVTRWLYRGTVELSTYCSFRDEESRDAARSMGVRWGSLGPAVPDLAFDLPTPASHPRRGHIVIGVMEYRGDPEGPEHGPEVVRRYIHRMVVTITRLVDGGRSVVVVIGDVADLDLADEIVGQVRARRPGLPTSQLAASRAATLADLMTEMAVGEAVVASRFHNLICALKLSKPTVSLGYADKNSHLLVRFGLDGDCQLADGFDVDRLCRDINSALARHSDVELRMRETLKNFDDALSEQFRELSSRFFEAPRTRAARMDRSGV